jgi:hypothetical protein
MKKLTTLEFIKKARSVHGDEYDYSKVVYVNASTKIEIICKKHGSFWQTPDKHCGSRQQGCHACSYGKRKYKAPETTEGFVERARKIHQEKYDYSQTRYKYAREKVEIICPIHGSFYQTASKHLMGHGCLYCGKKRAAEKNAITKESFVKRANKKHKNKYDYTKTIVISGEKKVFIKCPKHGGFWQTPASHLHGKGCPKCASFGFDSNKSGLLYLVKFSAPEGSFWKIGVTNKTIKKRFVAEAKDISEQQEWRHGDGKVIFKIERDVLEKFKKYRLSKTDEKLKIFKAGGHTECFTSSLPVDEVAAFIEQSLDQSPHPVPR